MDMPITLGVDPGVNELDHTAAFRHSDDGHSIAGQLRLIPAEKQILVGEYELSVDEIEAVVIEQPWTIPPHKDKKTGRMKYAAKSKDMDACIAAANILAYRLHDLGLKVFFVKRQTILYCIKEEKETIDGNRDSWLLAKLNRLGALRAEPDVDGVLRVKEPACMRTSHPRAALAASMVNWRVLTPWHP